VDVTVAGEPWMMGGDLITSLQDRPIQSIEDFISTMKSLKVGETVSVEFIRDRMRQRTSLVVAERPQGLSGLVPAPLGTGSPMPRSWSYKDLPQPKEHLP
jgi:hypothetical protein